ncbi:hypothetical protein SFyv_2294 [Shigella flexneri Shi06HN006]|nr:hypothetical protein SFyv_2294 [Shigella flexneri Shi06HN006]EGJ88985.1 hypothetical protein SF274771_1910 [Shigella flexneri 2747-71]EGJ89220.1 hypothetical protein SFK671_1961 [Shigella flexneri K-671]EIQ09802.1 hypothetical protein SF285071_2123 [Shigella flexneri 2850-71]EJL15025.1 hypothetical protein SF660363_1895 [Shigella flexneri 6603-63]
MNLSLRRSTSALLASSLLLTIGRMAKIRSIATYLRINAVVTGD